MKFNNKVFLLSIFSIFFIFSKPPKKLKEDFFKKSKKGSLDFRKESEKTGEGKDSEKKKNFDLEKAAKRYNKYGFNY